MTARLPAGLAALARRALSTLAAAAALAGVARAQATNGSVVVLAPSGEGVHGDTLASVTPTFLIQAVGFGPERPIRYRFQLSATPDFRVPLVFDTLFVSELTSVTMAPPFALGGGTSIYWRAIAIDLSGAARTSGVGGPLVVPDWVTPISPPEVARKPVATRRPTFVWRSPQVLDPPGPFEYQIRITSRGDTVLATGRIRDTTFTIPSSAELEPNLNYSWEVRAFLPRTGQAVTVPRSVSFFVEDSTLATSTILYQNFPNPFPTPDQTEPFTCIWFDLEHAARVQLEVYDLRGLLVRRLIPSEAYPGTLVAGRYGRFAIEANEGCDPRTRWDGRDSRGRVVPAGVYLLRFRADGIEQRRRILFRGG